MRKMSRASTIHIAVLLAAILFAPVVSIATEVSISLDNAVKTAIERNLDLRVETFNPGIADAGIERAQSIYNPRLKATFDHQGEDSQSAPSSSFFVSKRTFDANLSADVLLSTGATASAAFTNFWNRDNLDTSLSRYAKPELTLSFSQPILQGLGKEVTERGITVAQDAKAVSLAGWRTQAIGVGAKARDQFITVVKARENLETRRASLALAKRIHEENTARVRAGILAAIELLDSELGVSQREKDLLDAEKTALDESDRLKVLLQHPSEGELAPAGSFPEETVELRIEEALRIAMDNRPDLVGARISLRSLDFKAKMSRNLTLPSLALQGSAGVSGLGDSYGNAIDEMKTGNSPLWSVGLAFSYPFGNDAAKADLAEARLLAAQSRVSLKSLEESAAFDVRSAFRSLETRRKQIEVAEKGVRLAQTRLDSYRKRGSLGLSTTKDILQVESDLAAAKEGLTGARADYHSAVTALWKSTGELLERHGIQIRDKDIDSLVRKELR